MTRFSMALIAILATVACGNDDNTVGLLDAALVDAGMEKSTHDLSCMNNVPVVPATIRLDSALFDATQPEGFYDIPNTEVRVYRSMARR